MITCRLQARKQARQTLWYHLQLKQLIQARHIQEVRRRMKISLITLIWLTPQQAPQRNPNNVQLVNSLPNLAVYLIGQLAAMPVLIHLHFPCKFLLLCFHFFSYILFCLSVAEFGWSLFYIYMDRLPAEWTGSPVRMEKADRKQSQKSRRWRLSFPCFNF